ncbi:conserved hypothetical protein [Uncinocarpus reesii 1704]|uniref:AB hydrolase-1 domain-containing protein n=1 Tax=Uncinocarpus reesii (strain UAMH 1704) TaxID=336963 RepID=C4JI15_UNCRE|nr:uncharacterized protein UREG_01440 [Uncinocarpus reesii 1704]EEP76591.1 conserved hypothetical protein [Uncinocarpus reesii 1704]
MTITHHSPEDLGPIHPPRVRNLSTRPSNAQTVKIKVKDPLDHEAPAILHLPPDFDPHRANGAAVVLISGAGGGVSGPSGIYPSLAEKFSLLLSIPCIRLDYREPAHSDFCSADVLASFTYLSKHCSSTKFVLVGWSFGGSPCFTVAARDPERVRGIATVASQTAGTSGVRKLSPRPLLLLHGTGDTVLAPTWDDHGLTKNAPKAEKLIFDFAASCLGFGDLLTGKMEEKAGRDLAGSKEERFKEMQAGHDLEGGERI